LKKIGAGSERPAVALAITDRVNGVAGPLIRRASAFSRNCYPSLTIV
jgi:hypothetical protein